MFLLPGAFVLAIFKETKFLKARLDKFIAKKKMLDKVKKELREALLPRMKERFKDVKYTGKSFLAAKTLCIDFVATIEDAKLLEDSTIIP